MPADPHAVPPVPTDRGIEGLLARVREVAGPDRSLDGNLAFALGLPHAHFAQFDPPERGVGTQYVDGPDLCGPGCWAGNGHTYEAPQFTASLDAALELVERVLPGACTDVVVNALAEDGDRTNCAIINAGDDEGECVGAPTAPLAVLAALLTALAQQEAEHGR